MISTDNQRFVLTCILVSLFAIGSVGLAHAHTVVKQGQFTGLNGDQVSGQAQIVKTDNGYAVVLGKDFNLGSPAPDPRIGLGKNGQYDPATRIGPLRSTSGRQTYAVPGEVDVTEYNEVYVWCTRFAVGLGRATLR